jgi:hypothetical protein
MIKKALSAGALSLVLVAAASAADWDASLKHLDALNEDGTLYQRIELGGLVMGNNFEILSLEHVLFVGVDGAASSTWIVPQLETWLLPTGNGLRLRLPGGWSVDYARPVSSDANFKPALAKNDPEIRCIDTATFEFLLNSANVYTYAAGSLSRVRIRDGGIFSVQTNAGHIISIKAEADHAELLHARYDRAGKVESLTMADKTLRFRYESDAGLLVGVENASGEPILRLSYMGGRIARLEEAGNPPVTFAWSPNPSYHAVGMRRYLDVPIVPGCQSTG